MWRKVRDGLGGRLKAVVTGGASLSADADAFFEMVGVKVRLLLSNVFGLELCEGY